MTRGADRVVVVTGGAAGIGAAIASELGRTGAFVVTLDPNVALDGTPQTSGGAPTTAEQIVATGGQARAADISVTDRDAVAALFRGLVEEFGALHAVVNAAGISRPTSVTSGSEDDWQRVLSVHLDGYLSVLGAALPLMAQAGHGRIVGVTSGSGWRAANTGAYGCAKRAVAALTWQLGRVAPAGVTVNALSPIAATRMVAAGMRRASPGGGGADAAGIALAGFPPPERLGPIGAFLAGDELAWCSGQVFFSAGAEIAVVSPPRALEVVRSRPARSLTAVLADVVPAALVPAELAQASGGGSAARFEATFDRAAQPDAATSGGSCVVVAGDALRGDSIRAALRRRGVACTVVSAPGTSFAEAARQFADAATRSSPDAVVVTMASRSPHDDGAAGTWQSVLADHAGLTDAIRADAAWMRAAADWATMADQPLRLITLVEATSPGGRSRAQAATQLARAARPGTGDRLRACVVAVEGHQRDDQDAAVELAAHLATSASDAESLSGAELFVGAGRLGLRSHPAPSGTVSFGGPAVPDWLGSALADLVPATSTGGA